MVLVLRIGLDYITARHPSWWGLLPLPKNPTPLSASIFGPSGLIRQPLPAVFISPIHGGLDKTLVIPILEPKNASECRILYLKYTKNSGGGDRKPRTPTAEGETFVRTHPRAPLPDDGAPPLLLGWLRPCFPTSSHLFCMIHWGAGQLVP